MPEFSSVYAGPVQTKPPSEYLSNKYWVDELGSAMKGVNTVPVTDELKANADKLALAMEPRLGYHVVHKEDKIKQNHWTLRFARDNLPPMAAAMCLMGHIEYGIELYGIHERLLALL